MYLEKIWSLSRLIWGLLFKRVQIKPKYLSATCSTLIILMVRKGFCTVPQSWRGLLSALKSQYIEGYLLFDCRIVASNGNEVSLSITQLLMKTHIQAYSSVSSHVFPAHSIPLLQKITCTTWSFISIFIASDKYQSIPPEIIFEWTLISEDISSFQQRTFWLILYFHKSCCCQAVPAPSYMSCLQTVSWRVRWSVSAVCISLGL